MHNEDSLIYIGRILTAHGLQGELKVWSECRPPEAIFHYDHFYRRDGSILQLEHARRQGDKLLMRFKEHSDRSRAELLQGQDLFLQRAQLPRLNSSEDGVYWIDVIGMQVINLEGESLGQVRELYENGAQDILVIDGSAHGEILIPFVRPTFIRDMNLHTRQLRVNWPLTWLNDAD